MIYQAWNAICNEEDDGETDEVTAEEIEVVGYSGGGGGGGGDKTDGGHAKKKQKSSKEE